MSTRAITHVLVEMIECAPQVRTRFDDDTLRLLTASIAGIGLQQPIRVTSTNAKGKYRILDGERRYRSVLSLGWKEVEVIIEDYERTEVDVLIHALVANCHRDDLSPIDLARAIRVLITDGKLTAGQAAAHIAVSAPTVTRTLTLLTLPREVQEHVHVGRIAAGTGYAIAKERDPKKRARLVARALKGELSRDSAAEATRRRTVQRKVAGKSQRVWFALGNDCRLSIVGGEQTVGDACSRVGGLVARLRMLARSEMSLADAAQVIAKTRSLNGDDMPQEDASV